MASDEIEYFKIVYSHYQNDFQLFWQRTNFFLLVDAGLLGFFVTKEISVTQQCFLLIVCIAGGVLSIIWLLVSMSSISWINTWRLEVVRLDEEIKSSNDKLGSFSNGEEIKSGWWPFKFRLLLRPELISASLPALFIFAWAFFYISLTGSVRITV
jgi:hypothetical protein